MNIRFPVATFSSALGYSKGTVSQYYNGKKEISDKFIAALEGHYGIELDNFRLGYPESPENVIILDERIFNDPARLGLFVRFLTANHERLKQDELYRLYLQRAMREMENDSIAEKAREKLKNK